jgi:hypothetical protein
MTGRMAARRAFLLEDAASRIRRIASNLEAVRGHIADGQDDLLRARLDECSWLIEWAVPDAARDIQSELVELQHTLTRWRALEPSGPARAVALDGAHIWAERLLWVAALLEATS